MARKLVQPGHIFPIEVRSGGVLVRAALPEAAHDLCVLSGYTDAALFLDLLNAEGNCMSREEQQALSAREHIPEILLSELIEYRLSREPIVSRIAEARLPTQFDEHLTAVSYTSLLDKTEHLAIIHGEPQNAPSCLVRVHVEATVSDVFGGNASSTREQLHTALRAITQQKAGVLVYLRRGENNSPRKPEKDVDSDETTATITRPAMMRDYGMGAQILRDLGVTRATILSNSVSSLLGLDSFGITVIGTQRLDGNK
jgi:3,4-dihydroxy 2-butanone 4-phosphate synthase/GTP cyclohydrolase II